MTDAEDEIFRRLTEDLDIDPGQIVHANASSLTDLELVRKTQSLREELYERREMLHPTTDTGKDLSAMFAGCLLEMRRRHLR